MRAAGHPDLQAGYAFHPAPDSRGHQSRYRSCDHLPQPAVPEEQDEEDPIPDFRRMPSRAASAVIPEPGSLDGIVRTRRSEQFGILFWVVVLVVGLIWNGVIVISRWRENFVTSIGSPVNQPTTSAAWYSSLDRFNVLLTWETLFIVGVAVIVYLRNRDSRRIRIRSSRRYN